MTRSKVAFRTSTAVVLTSLVIGGCANSTTESDDGDAPSTTPSRIVATEVLEVVGQQPGGTLLEGPTFHENGDLYLVDVMAQPGAPKVLRVDLESREVSTVFTDDGSAFTSAQFSPADGRLYLTDIVSGSIVSITADGQDPRTLFTGEVDGIAMLPDDIAFDPAGNLFVSDTRGMLGPGWETPGRVVRISTDGNASVLVDNLPSPNGIVFDETDTGLYVSQYNANRIDYYALDDTATRVQAAYPAIYVNAGKARVDSTAVDAAGNIYQAFHNKPVIEVFSSTGEHLATIDVPESDADGLDSATNIAIEPGTTDGYMTVSGPSGGYIYAFDALADGIRQSNGG